MYPSILIEVAHATIVYSLNNGASVIRNYSYHGENKKINALITAIESEHKYKNLFDYLDEIGVKYSVKSIYINNYTNDDVIEYAVDSGDYDKVINLCKEDIKTLTDNYSSLKHNSEFYNDVDIECRLDKSNSKEVLDELRDCAYNVFVEGYVAYDDYDDGYPGYFDIHISKLPDSSKVLQFAKEKK